MPTNFNKASAAALAFFVCLTQADTARAQAISSIPALPSLRLSLTGPSEKIYDNWTDACAPVDLPDVNPRAYRAADGSVSMFALHFVARALRGPDLLNLKIDCRVALDSKEDADPAHYNGRRYIASLWTTDGKNVSALVHNEYHADIHPGRCRMAGGLECWWNSVLAVQSKDGGQTFQESTPLVVAATPFRQDAEQGRHRGFFNPSNMFAMGPHVYVITSTTGWSGQQPGACLLRNASPRNSAGWRGYDGRSFSVRWHDPYGPATNQKQESCAPIEPFGYPVASVVRHRASGTFVALWEAPRVEGKFPVAGFYYATSKDLLHWSQPMLLIATAISHDPCGRNESNRDGAINTYPAILDAGAQGRNFDDTGDDAWLFFAHIKNIGCNPAGRRTLMRQRLHIAPASASDKPH